MERFPHVIPGNAPPRTRESLSEFGNVTILYHTTAVPGQRSNTVNGIDGEEIWR